MSCRDAFRLKDRWDGADVVQGDVLIKIPFKTFSKDIDTAYYLIHSMGGDSEFSETDIIAAENFARAAEESKSKKNYLSWWISIFRMKNFQNIYQVDYKRENR